MQVADYYPLIARAVAGLEKNTGDARRLVYERARTALVAHLRSAKLAKLGSETRFLRAAPAHIGARSLHCVSGSHKS